MESEKTVDGRLLVRKQETREATYDVTELKRQLEAIEAQKAREIEQRDAEIEEVQGLLEECAKLGIVDKADAAVISEG